MWDEVGQALSHSMTKMLSQVASLLPGIVALMTALLVSALIAWAVAAILRRSLAGFEFDRRVAQWGFPALAEWSPSSSPTLLVTRAAAGMVILAGFLVGISAFDGALPSQLVIRIFTYLPDVIGVVTSPTGAVIRDILHRLADRFPRRERRKISGVDCRCEEKIRSGAERCIGRRCGNDGDSSITGSASATRPASLAGVASFAVLYSSLPTTKAKRVSAKPGR